MRGISPEAHGAVSWSFLTNYALVLIHVSREPESTGLELAQAVGITERATRRILGHTRPLRWPGGSLMERRRRKN